MNALIIGYGSIGKRHYEVLSQISFIKRITVVSNQVIFGLITYSTLEKVPNLENYDYIVIASETHMHFDQINYIEQFTKNTIILCEKPLFNILQNINIKKNTIYLGYVLRFHPLLQKLRLIINEDKPFYVQIMCGSYLPLWRSNTDYRKSYSAIKHKGGGALLDLSHEIDYMEWLFGSVNTINSYQNKVSDLEIGTDDLVIATGKTSNEIVFNLSLDYISKISIRELIIHTKNQTIRADLIKNTLQIGIKDGSIQTIEIENFDRNDLFRKMHLSALGNKESLCTLSEGLSVMETISTIQRQNNG